MDSEADQKRKTVTLRRDLLRFLPSILLLLQIYAILYKDNNLKLKFYGMPKNSRINSLKSILIRDMEIKFDL